MTGELSDDDRGKTVVNDTDRIGTVTDVRGGTAYVDPDWDHLPEDLRDALGWSEGDDRHAIDEEAVTAVQNSQIRIREDLSPQ
ncbi:MULTISPECIES: PRC-barrel domain containing protein [Halorussus]|uniref:PRC-barrel domain containing protein n=1 Tax=Halorussus TaxID=1070314 RepID=UPI000E214EA3|nr:MULTISPECIES: PRC-barrel domain containing protein [Halorussus]NHN60918.1 PRC-barrel domain containing protein [Halorussus sp. JP-T4]